MGCVRVCEVFQGLDMVVSDLCWVELVVFLNWVWLLIGMNDGYFVMILYFYFLEKFF